MIIANAIILGVLLLFGHANKHDKDRKQKEVNSREISSNKVEPLFHKDQKRTK